MNVIGSIDGLEMGAIGPNSMVNADCLEAMKLIPDNSIDLICTDPPYFKVKKDSWDRQWDKPKEFLSWLDSIAEQWHRILKPNGSLYCFASPRMAARVEVMLSDRFNVCNHLVWDKSGRSRAAMTCKEASRIYFPESERILFCEHYGADNIAKGEAGYGAKCDELRGFVFEPLRAYLDSARKLSGLTLKDISIEFQKKTGSKTQTGAASNWFHHPEHGLPSCENYIWLQSLIGPNLLTRSHKSIQEEYSRLWIQYEDLRLEYEDLRRPFSVTADVPYTDVWTYPTVNFYPGKHPCEKNLDMLEHIITASSRKGAIVLDSFSGSANTAKACLNTDRKYICIEKDLNYFQTSCDRVANHDPKALVTSKKAKKPRAIIEGQLALFV